jgi:hypothetical protein
MPVKISLVKNLPVQSKIHKILREERRAALLDSARYVRSLAARYPQQNPKTAYRRTGTLGRSVAVGEVAGNESALRVEVGTNLHYAPYVEYGTGIYGPKGQPIRPKSAKALAWRATGGALARAGLKGGKLIAMGIALRKGKPRRWKKHDAYMMFARSVKGFPGWHFMRNAFADTGAQKYFIGRLEAMFARIQERLAAGQ